MFGIFRKVFTNIGVDLGTANTIVFVVNKGFVVNEPSIIAYKEKNNVICVGHDAKEMFGKTHKDITVIRPLAGSRLGPWWYWFSICSGWPAATSPKSGAKPAPATPI